MVSECSFVTLGKAPANGPHIAVVERALDKGAESGRVCGSDAPRPVGHKKMENGVIGRRNGATKTRLPGLLGFARCQMVCLLEQVVM